MKSSQKRRRRFVRALAIAGAVTALAVPVSAGAMPVDPHNPPSIDYTQSTGNGAQLDHRGLGYTAPVTVTREVRTVVHDDNGRTLEIALAASALGIALCGAGYAVVRVTQIQRRLGVSH